MSLDFTTLFLGACGIGWLYFSLRRLLDVLTFPTLEGRARDLAAPSRPPRVAVVMPARNEAHRVEESVRRILAQRGVEVRLIVVDDRSEDDTRGIVERLAADEPRLEGVRVDALPENWLGKCHACAVGAERALRDGAEWILFTDADTWLAPELLERAVRVARADDASLLCLFPTQQIDEPLGRAATIGFTLGFFGFAARTNRDRPLSPIGIGAFNLVRADAYRACGGYEALHLEVIDDMKLGLLIQRNGGRLRCYGAPGDVDIDWAAGASELPVALEKNSFALLQYNYPVAIAIVATIFAAWGAGILGPFSGHPAGWLAAAGLYSTAIPGYAFARRVGWGPAGALLTPFVYFVIPLTLARSTWFVWRRGGVRWRDTFYPVELLRKHMVRLL